MGENQKHTRAPLPPLQPPPQNVPGAPFRGYERSRPPVPPYAGPMPVSVAPLPPPPPKPPPAGAAAGAAHCVWRSRAGGECGEFLWHELLAFNCCIGGVHEAASVSRQVASVKAAPQEDTHSAAEPSPMETLPRQGAAAFGAQRFGLHTCAADTGLGDTGGAARQLQQPGGGGGTGVSSATVRSGSGDKNMPSLSPVCRGRTHS